MPTHSETNKVSRIDLRVSFQQKELLERAAALKGLSLSAYMLSHCLEAAKAEIQAHQKIELSDRDRDLFLELMANPPSPKETLVKAMREFQDEYEDA